MQNSESREEMNKKYRVEWINGQIDREKEDNFKCSPGGIVIRNGF